jgi:hypothetical protein
MKMMFQMMNEARIAVGLQGAAIANAAYQSALNLSRKGLLDPRQFSQIETSMAAYLKCPGVRDWWKEVKPFWPEHVGQRMDQIVAEYSGLPMSDALSFYARTE